MTLPVKSSTAVTDGPSRRAGGRVGAPTGVYSTTIRAARFARAQTTASVIVMSPLATPWVSRSSSAAWSGNGPLPPTSSATSVATTLVNRSNLGTELTFASCSEEQVAAPRWPEFRAVGTRQRALPAYFIRSWILAMAVRAQSSSNWPPGAPLTPSAPIAFPPAMMVTPPTAYVTLGSGVCGTVVGGFLAIRSATAFVLSSLRPSVSEAAEYAL